MTEYSFFQILPTLNPLSHHVMPTSEIVLLNSILSFQELTERLVPVYFCHLTNTAKTLQIVTNLNYEVTKSPYTKMGYIIFETLLAVLCCLENSGKNI